MELFNPHSNDWLKNKFSIYNDLRNRDTAYWSDTYKMYVITRYDDVVFALNNPEIFSSAYGNLIVEDSRRFGQTLGASDNPTHDFLKNIVRNAYSKDNMDRIASCFSHHARRLLSDKDNLNLSDVISELSAWCVAEIINFPYDKKEVVDLIIDIQKKSSLATNTNIDDSSYKEFRHILKKLWVPKIEPLGPGIYNEFYYNDSIDLDPNEQHPRSSLFVGPIISGASSMAGGLQFLTLDLHRSGKLHNLLNDKSLIPSAVNESLRYNASTGRFSRTVKSEVELHGVKLMAGDRVALCLDSANRDPRAFTNPDVFDLGRQGSKSLAFGHGMHACIALSISKNIMSTWLELLFDIFGNYRITTLDSELEYLMTASGNNDLLTNLYIEKTLNLTNSSASA